MSGNANSCREKTLYTLKYDVLVTTELIHQTFTESTDTGESGTLSQDKVLKVYPIQISAGGDFTRRWSTLSTTGAPRDVEKIII